MKRPRYEDLELVVETEPIQPVCAKCGSDLPDWEWTGLCDDCVMRSGNPCGIFVAIALFALAVVTLGWLLAAPRSAPDPGPSQAGLIGQERTGVPLEPRGGIPSTGAVLPGALPGGSPTAAPVATVRYRGTATWYCGHGSPCTRGYGSEDLVAAIDRKDTTFRKGDVVVVRYSCGDGCLRAVRVTIVDTCACADRRVIDLTTGAFERLAPLGMGVLPVTVELAGAAPTLPPTDTQEDQP